MLLIYILPKLSFPFPSLLGKNDLPPSRGFQVSYQARKSNKSLSSVWMKKGHGMKATQRCASREATQCQWNSEWTKPTD